MLVSKEVEVRVVPYTLKHYKSIYKNVECNEIIKVNITDLPSGSKQKIKVQCDDCKEILDFEFINYVKYNKDFLNSTYKCRECEIKRIWNNVEATCKQLDLILISKIKDYKTHKTKINFICNKHKEYGIQEISVNALLSKKQQCKVCTNEKRSKSVLLDFNIVKDKFIQKNYFLLEEKYISARSKMKYICPKHPEFIQEISYDKLNRGQGCNHCGNEAIAEALKHHLIKF